MSMNTDQNHSDPDQDRPDHQDTGNDKTDQPERTTLFKDLLSRRVPQILGGYLAASWIILEFMDWLTGRYPISPHLVDFCLVTLAAMIPTIFLLSYYPFILLTS